jgi:uncharacterized protein
MDRIVHFEIPADDVKRAREFYETVFGWKFQRWEGPVEYLLARTGEKDKIGIDGAITKRHAPLTGVVNTLLVDSVEDALKRIKSGGGTVIQPKTEVAGMGHVAYFKDTEGNVTGVFQTNM